MLDFVKKNPRCHRQARAGLRAQHRRGLTMKRPAAVSMFDHNETLEEARARNVHDALFEDVGVCDWTAQLVPANERVQARLIVREEAVLCGRDWFDGLPAAARPKRADRMGL
jgi:hypothetical protein